MKLLSKKKGSVAIFIMLFFVSLLTLIYAYIAAAKGIAVKSAAKELGQVWAESVLGEYNLDLQEKYNIFGFYGSSKELNSKLNYYASESFDTKNI